MDGEKVQGECRDRLSMFLDPPLPQISATGPPGLRGCSRTWHGSPLFPAIWNLPIPQGSVQLETSPLASQLTCASPFSKLLKKVCLPVSQVVTYNLLSSFCVNLPVGHLQDQDCTPFMKLNGGRACSRYSINTFTFNKLEQVRKQSQGKVLY